MHVVNTVGVDDESPQRGAILAIMAKAPRAGHVKTRLGSAYPADVVVELYRALIEDTIALARSIDVAIAVVCPADDVAAMTAWLPSDVRIAAQRGQGLADALSSAFEALCDPPRRVIALNGDSPHLPRDVLRAAFAALAEHDVVFGPCEDGGYYLVGATRPHAGLFHRNAMGTSSALVELMSHAKRLGLSSACTAEHYDVDLPADLARLALLLRAEPHRARRTAALLAGMSFDVARCESFVEEGDIDREQARVEVDVGPGGREGIRTQLGAEIMQG